MTVVGGMTSPDNEDSKSPRYNCIGLASGDISAISRVVAGFVLVMVFIGVIVASTDSSILSDLTKQEVSAPVE